MQITYKSDITPTASQVIELYDSAGLPRPTNDPERIQKMFDHSNLIVSAWDGDKLVGVARTITDWAWSSYLADLAVSPEYQQFGIGRQLLAMTKQLVGEESMILLLSVPGAMEYYPKVGFSKEDRGFIMHRTK
ncbi:Acetyltransferase (GNAT) domain-containing protein [Chitinophaga sp. YR627]|uniref:GNAT family N-acetyltransferase n=1 Tax=Chitinophaga sp. YR627 TaxID=1881041 RepID=UPI0008E657A8|nr:GNAT family N-acetyltransferase [Chitinophaga sp. YR627]SFO48002.1 Acetyltransferase (GNAT) domain-containing protein [Chitinophaga sp. YR627]